MSATSGRWSAARSSRAATTCWAGRCRRWTASARTSSTSAACSAAFRRGAGGGREIIVATNATVDGQTTAHYLAERLSGQNVPVTRLAHGVPVGGELDWL